MRIWFLIAVPILAIGLMITFTGTALADNPPHDGDFTATTDACGGCHRVHRAKGLNLLKVATETELCYSCHGLGGLGADTNVEYGVLENASGGGAAAALRGGGFAEAFMDPSVSNNWASAPTSSQHDIYDPLTNSPMGIVWGSGDIGSGVGAGEAQLKCTSCHNPHGFAGYDQYRILRPIPHIQATGFPTLTVPIMLVDQQSDPKDYTPQIETRTIAGATAYYRQAADTPTNISNWCSQCHTRYMASAPDDTTSSGDPIFTYRHNVDKDGSYGPRCLECHLAHGTTATMGTISSLVEDPSQDPGLTGVPCDPNGNPPCTPTGSSSLLTTHNRGVCVRCHNQESRHPFPNPP